MEQLHHTANERNKKKRRHPWGYYILIGAVKLTEQEIFYRLTLNYHRPHPQLHIIRPSLYRPISKH